MDSELLLNCGGNLLTVGVVLMIFVVYKRCLSSKCTIHSSWLDCESPEVKAAKLSETRINIKKALMEHQPETSRTIINGRSEGQSI